MSTDFNSPLVQWHFRFERLKAELLTNHDKLSIAFRNAVLSMEELLLAQAQVNERLALEAQHKECLESRALLESLDLQLGEWVTVEAPPALPVTLAVRYARSGYSPNQVELMGTYVSKAGELLRKRQTVLFQPTGGAPYRMTRHHKVSEIEPYVPPVWDYVGRAALFTDEERAVWRPAKDPVEGSDWEDTQLERVLWELVAGMDPKALVAEAKRLGGAAMAEVACGIFLQERARFTEKRYARTAQKLMSLCRFSPGQRLVIGQNKIAFIKKSLVGRNTGPKLRIVGQPVFSDGTPAGEPQSFDLEVYDAERVRVARN